MMTAVSSYFTTQIYIEIIAIDLEIRETSDEIKQDALYRIRTRTVNRLKSALKTEMDRVFVALMEQSKKGFVFN